MTFRTQMIRIRVRIGRMRKGAAGSVVEILSSAFVLPALLRMWLILRPSRNRRSLSFRSLSLWIIYTIILHNARHFLKKFHYLSKRTKRMGDFCTPCRSRGVPTKPLVVSICGLSRCSYAPLLKIYQKFSKNLENATGCSGQTPNGRLFYLISLPLLHPWLHLWGQDFPRRGEMSPQVTERGEGVAEQSEAEGATHLSPPQPPLLPSKRQRPKTCFQFVTIL